MRISAYVLIAVVAVAQGSGLAQAPAAQTPPPAATAKPTGPPRPATMKELMADLFFPTADVIFYVARGEPKDDAEWIKIQMNGLMLAELANILMTPARAYDQKVWAQDAKLLLDVGVAAYRAAQRRDYEALVELNEGLYEACQSCHVHYRPGYQRRP